MKRRRDSRCLNGDQVASDAVNNRLEYEKTIEYVDCFAQHQATEPVSKFFHYF